MRVAIHVKQLSVKISIHIYCCIRFYNEALSAVCDEGLLGVFVMMVSAVISALCFTILVWCHLNTWSHFKREEVKNT